MALYNTFQLLPKKLWLPGREKRVVLSKNQKTFE